MTLEPNHLEYRTIPGFDGEFALISDIHGNSAALNAVLDDIPARINHIVCLGDIIGFGPHPKECLDMVRTQCNIILKGCNEQEFLERDIDRGASNVGDAGLHHAQRELTTNDLGWIRDLPERVHLNDEFLFCHHHPEIGHAIEDYMYSNKYPRLLPYFDGFDVRLIGLGHTHHAAYGDFREIGDYNGVIVNPGSVGLPSDNSIKATYAIVDGDTLDAKTRRISYDIESMQAAVEDAGLPDKMAELLETRIFE